MKWFWLILIVFLCCGCGLFKKNKHIQEVNYEHSTNRNLELSVFDTIYKTKNKKSYIQTVRKYTPILDSMGNIRSVLTEETTTEFKESNAETKGSQRIKANKNTRENKKGSTKTIDKAKEADKTIKANVPWWAVAMPLSIIITALVWRFLTSKKIIHSIKPITNSSPPPPPPAPKPIKKAP